MDKRCRILLVVPSAPIAVEGRCSTLICENCDHEINFERTAFCAHVFGFKTFDLMRSHLLQVFGIIPISDTEKSKFFSKKIKLQA